MRAVGGDAGALGFRKWPAWLDEKGQQAMVEAFYAVGWAYTSDRQNREWFHPHSNATIALGLAGAPPRPPPITDLQVLSDLTIRAGVDVPLTTLVPLFRYCRVTHLDPVVTFKLDKRHLAELPATTSAEEELLTALNPAGPLPDNVRHFLAGQPAIGGKLHFHYCRGVVLLDDPRLASVLQSHPKLKGYLERFGAAGFLAIKGGSNPSAFLARCRQHGFEVEFF